MTLIRTTIRLPEQLKDRAELRALEEKVSFQEIQIRALKKYLNDQATKDAKKIVFHSHDFGRVIDNLTRDDFYD